MQKINFVDSHFWSVNVNIFVGPKSSHMFVYQSSSINCRAAMHKHRELRLSAKEETDKVLEF